MIGEREECAGPAEGPDYAGYEVARDLTTGVLAFGVLGAIGPVPGSRSASERRGLHPGGAV